MSDFAGLTPAERERLEMLIEEAAEIVQAGTKILRHGYNNHHPKSLEETNRRHLEDELMQFWAVYERMAFHGEVKRLDFYTSASVWADKVRWTYHQPEFRHPTLRDKSS